MKEDEWLSRDNLLGGLPARRASLLLFAIESRTAQLVASDQRDAAPYLPHAVVEERESEFLAALAAGRNLPIEPVIQDIERYGPYWAPLVPEDASIRAALAHMMGQKYRFTRGETPQLQKALGLGTPAVQQAHQDFYGLPLDTIYIQQDTLGQRLRWSWAGLAGRMEKLPSFWVAFFLTMPGAAGLIAMPIVLVDLGPLLGITLLVVFALINLITVAALSEASARSDTTHFGLGYIGQMAQEYLGATGAHLVTVVLAANNFVVLIIFFLGVGSTLEGATHLPTEGWMLVLFGICLYFLMRGSFNATVASTLLVVFVIIALMVAIPTLAIPYFSLSNLVSLARPFAAKDFTWAALGPVFGVLFSTFLSHVLIPAYGPVVLRRDRSGRSLFLGSTAALLTFLLVACLWLLIAEGAIAPESLRTAPGTVITPLAELVGPGVIFLGAVLVVLSLGLATIQVALGLYYLTQERLGTARRVRVGVRARFLIAIIPIVVAGLVAEILAFNDVVSFANLLGILGALALPVISGVVPLLLLLSTRRKGDFVPAIVVGWLGNPIIIILLLCLFIGTILIHGILIWDAWPSRLFALVGGIVVLAATLLILRRKALTPRTVLGLHIDERLDGVSAFYAAKAGHSYPLMLELGDSELRQKMLPSAESAAAFIALRRMHAVLMTEQIQEVKVWARRTKAEGQTVSLASSLVVNTGGHATIYDLGNNHGQVEAFVVDGMCEVELEGI